MGAVAAAAVVVVLALSAFSPDTHGARVLHFTLHSRLLHRSLPVTVVVPAGRAGGRRPLLVFLHGKGEDQDSHLDDAMFAALARSGRARPTSSSPTAAPTPTGTTEPAARWGTYVTDEVIPPACAACTPTRSGWRSAASRWAASARSTSPGCIRGGSAPSGATPRRCGRRGPTAPRRSVRRCGGLRPPRRRSAPPARTTPTGQRRSGSTPGPTIPFRATDAELAAELRAHGHRVASACLARRPRRRLLAAPLGQLPGLLREGAGGLSPDLRAAPGGLPRRSQPAPRTIHRPLRKRAPQVARRTSMSTSKPAHTPTMPQCSASASAARAA